MIWMYVREELADSTPAKTLSEKSRGSTCVPEPLPRAPDHPGDLRRSLIGRKRRLDESDSSLRVPHDDDVVEPHLGLVGRPTARLDAIEPIEVSFAGWLASRVPVEVRMRENDRHFGGVADTQWTECEGLSHPVS